MKLISKTAISIFCGFFLNLLLAQQPTDCINSVIVCGNSNVNLNVSGIGNQELAGSNTCASQENNSVWLQVTLVTDGTLGFILTPNSTSIIEDYDFFIFGPNVSCGNIGQAIRCSTTNPQAANQGNNLTGMNSSESDTAEGPGPAGNSFVRWLNVRAGDTYFIVIDRPIGNSAFTLQWTGSAQFSSPPTNQSGLGNSLNFETCDDTAPFNDGLTEFNLADNTNTIIGSQLDVIVTYHTNISDANIGINPIFSRRPFTNTQNPQTIFARITNIITGCFNVIDFELNILLSPHFAQPSDYILCDNSDDGNDANGQVVFDLQTKNNEILDGQDPNNISISYHESLLDAENGSGVLPNLYYNSDSGFQQIYVRIEDLVNTNCQLSITTLNLIVNPLPLVFNTTLIQCDEDGTVDGLTLFNLNEANDAITGGNLNLSTFFYLNANDAQSNNTVNALNGNNFSNTLNPQTIYVSVLNNNTQCINTSTLILDVSLTNSGDAQLFVCDDDGLEDGFHTFNLNDADNDIVLGLPAGLVISYYETYEDALLEDNILEAAFVNTIPYNQTIYARVENANDCYGISQVALTVYELPDINTEVLTYYCLNTFPQTIPLDADVIDNMPENYTYSWSSGENTYEIEVNQTGNYSVTVTKDHPDGTSCSKQRNIIVEASNIAIFESIKVVDATQNNTITIMVSGEGIYEYALLNNGDGFQTPFQSSHIFENVFPGIYTVLVRDVENDCGTVQDQVSVIGFPKFFTPNNDGRNDTWQVYGLSSQFQPNSKVLIFNRYGKLIKQISPTGSGWDGTFNGNILPNDDYWFSVTLQDGRAFKNHFTLKR